MTDLRARGAACTQAVPTPQATRGRQGCICDGPCFYCGRPTYGSHEHDHAPLPYRHGGRETVPSCKACHDLKDRVKINRWPQAAREAAAAGLGAVAATTAAYCIAMAQGDDVDVTPLDVLNAIESTTTPEARIAVAQMYCMALDQRAAA